MEGRFTKLSIENGISISDLGTILVKLGKCLEYNDVKFTLVGVENTSYTPLVDTEDEAGVEAFKSIHSEIGNNDFNDLPKEYQEYADALNDILFENGIYLEATNTKDNIVIPLSSIAHQATIHTYFSITSIYGTIVSLIGKNEKSPYITIKTTHGIDFKIFVKSDQEKKLKQFYKEDTIRFRVRQKISTKDNKPIEGTLLDYLVPERISFSDALQKAKSEFGDVFSHIDDSAELIRQLRNS